MKYKIAGLSVTALALIAVIMISFSMPEDNGRRYVEHIMAEEKTPCTNHTESEFCSHLPVVKIDTDGVEIPGKPIYDKEYRVIDYTLAQDGTTTIRASLDVINNEKTYNHLTDNATSMGDIMIRVRGHSSRRFEKANYFIRFINDD